jgi:hypothetical protein
MYQGGLGVYHSSTVSTATQIFSLRFWSMGDDGISVATNSSKSEGFAVRCVTRHHYNLKYMKIRKESSPDSDNKRDEHGVYDFNSSSRLDREFVIPPPHQDSSLMGCLCIVGTSEAAASIQAGMLTGLPPSVGRLIWLFIFILILVATSTPL